MNGSKASIDEIIKFLNEKGVNPKAGILVATLAYTAAVYVIITLATWRHLLT